MKSELLSNEKIQHQILQASSKHNTFFYFKADNGVSRWMGNAVGHVISLFTCFSKI